jgi:hypothetical protein
METAKSTTSMRLSGNWRTSPTFTSDPNVRSAVMMSNESVSFLRELPTIDRRRPMHDRRKSEEFESRARSATDTAIVTTPSGTGQGSGGPRLPLPRHTRWDGSGALPVREVEALPALLGRRITKVVAEHQNHLRRRLFNPARYNRRAGPTCQQDREAGKSRAHFSPRGARVESTTPLPSSTCSRLQVRARTP